MQKFKMDAKNDRKTIFGKTWKMTQCIHCGLKSLLKSPNVFLHFTHKVKIAAKNGGKTIFWQKLAEDSTHVGQKFCQNLVTLYERNAFFNLTQNFKMTDKNGSKAIFGKKYHMTLRIPWRPKTLSKSYLTFFIFIVKKNCSI